jgi:hypothetical protein
MGSVRHPRGRLPQRVYWIRRSVVLVVALLLVFGIGKLLGGNGQDPSSTGVEASNTAAQQQQQSSAPPSLAPVAPAASASSKVKQPLVAPTGECQDDEVSVLPSVPRAWGAQPITIRLALTGIAPACTFKVSPDSVVVKITSGSDRIWSSQDCPTSVKPADVVVRNGVPSYVNVVWSGRRSDESCSRSTPWANAGFYHAFAAVLGSTPTDVQFEVTRAPTAVVTKTAKPKPSQSPTPTPKTNSPAKPSATATVSGKGSKCGGDNAAGSC